MMRGLVGLRHAGGLLAISSALRLLDGGGWLPGVNESHRVRAASQNPRILLLWVPVALMAGCSAAAVTNDARLGRVTSAPIRWALTLVAFPAMFGISETAAHAGTSLHWDELGWPVALQVLLAAAFLAAAVVVGRGLGIWLPEVAAGVPPSLVATFASFALGSHETVQQRGRGPPLAAAIDRSFTS